MLDEYTMLVFTTFLTLIYGLQLLIIRTYSRQKQFGLLNWSLYFLLYSAAYIQLLFIDRQNPSLSALLLLQITFFLSLIFLQRGWHHYFSQRGGRPYLFFATVILLSALILQFTAFLEFEYIIGLMNALLTGRVALFIFLQYRNKHKASLLISALLSGLAFFMALIPLLTELMYTLLGFNNLFTELLNGFAYLLQDGCLMFSIILATIHRDMLHDRRVIKEKEQLTAKLEELSVTDSMTGINNRRGFMRILDYEYEQLQRGSGAYAIVLGDIDLFKRVNDCWGHDCGDMVIRTAAQTISDNIRSQDSLARWGGEEFILLLKGGTPEEYRAVTERIRQNIEVSRPDFQGEAIPFTMSFGLSPARPEDSDGETAVIRADMMLYKAKEGGRNRSVLSDSSSEAEDA